MALVAALSLTDHDRSCGTSPSVSFVTGMGMAFYYPAYSAWLPALVPESDLMAVNGFEGMVRPDHRPGDRPGRRRRRGRRGLAGRRDRGGGGRVAARPARADDGAADAGAPRLRGRGRARHPVASALADMREGFVYMVRTPWLLATLLFASLMILVMMGPLEVLVPFLIKDRLGGGPGDHAWVLAAFGIGGAVGLDGDGVAPDAAPLPDPDEPACGASAACRSWSSASPPPSGRSWSRRSCWARCSRRRWSSGARCSSAGCPPHMLGRVASLDFFVSISLMPVSMALAGPVSEAIGLRTTFAIAGIAPGRLRRRRDRAGPGCPQDEIAHPLRDEDEAARGPPRSCRRSEQVVSCAAVLAQVADQRHRIRGAEAQGLRLGEVRHGRRLRLARHLVTGDEAAITPPRLDDA